VYRAETYVGIMEEAQALVKAHLERIARLLAEEMVRQAEQLKVQVKAAEVEQGLLQARASRRLARSNLARLVGLDLDASLALTERFPDPPPPYPLTLAQCVARALRGRPEIRMTQLGQAQARAGRAAKLWQLVPTVAAVAQFEANHGTGSFLPKASFFVGAVMEWELDWGKTLRDADEISAKGQRAAALEHKARTAIPMEVRKYHSDLEVALASLKVTRAAVTAATESLRIQVKRFELSAAASTDVLDAQMDLTQARAKATDALHRYYLARAALDRVMGDER
jgi:outer membrane protein TolC